MTENGSFDWMGSVVLDTKLMIYVEEDSHHGGPIRGLRSLFIAFVIVVIKPHVIYIYIQI